VEVISTTEVVEIELQTELVGEEIETVKLEVDIKPLVLIQVEIQNYNKGNTCLEGYIILSFHFCHFTRISRKESKVQKG
jgi:hypothetical protein